MSALALKPFNMTALVLTASCFFGPIRCLELCQAFPGLWVSLVRCCLDANACDLDVDSGVPLKGFDFTASVAVPSGPLPGLGVGATSVWGFACDHEHEQMYGC